MKHATRFALAATFAVLAWTACAQEYPSRGVTIIVPYPAGGPPTSWHACWRRNSRRSSDRIYRRERQRRGNHDRDRPGRTRDT